ncbi:solute carrier family 43 member 3-like isoform X1 [Gigantopelta aegis]|uniref:solute carrier family 43 member 3-like isoform X1 n=1 Tax=Gigantopelta aegis TaxID=1735272 RepID=UPI001B88ACE7|nr:solute carrier family 43 member 3-like isoform X1 [Gigantopelta aegis]
MIFISTFFFLPRKIIHEAEFMKDLSIRVKIDSEVCEEKNKSQADHDGNKSQVDHGVTRADGNKSQVDHGVKRADGNKSQVDHGVTRADGNKSQVDHGVTRADGNKSQVDHGVTRADGNKSKVDHGVTRADGNKSQVDHGVTRADGNNSQVDHGITRADGNKSQVDEAQLANGSECAKDVSITMDDVSISKHVEQVKDNRGNKEQMSSSCSRDGQRSLKSCLLSAPFILHVLWMSVLNLRALYFIQTLNPWLNVVFNNDKSKVSYYTDAWLYTMMGSILTSLLAGAIHDWQKKVFAKSLSVKRCQRMPYVLPLSLTTVLGVCLSVLMFVPLSESLYATFIDFVLLRSFLFAMTISFLSSIFPTEYYTVLLGCLLITVALFSTLQYALFEWVKVTSYDQVNLFLVFLVCVAFLHPAYQWYKSRQAEFKVKKQQTLDGEIK